MIVSNVGFKNCLNYVGRHFSAPEQKIVLTLTALGIQPLIDMKNKHVDQETRKTSTARNIAKIIAGAITGITIRYLGIEVAKKLTKFTPILDETGKLIKGISKKDCGLFMKFFTDQKFTQMPLNTFNNRIDNYRKAFGTLLATLTMVYTNFTLDAPWTNKLTPHVHKALFHEDPVKGTKTGSSTQAPNMFITQRPKAKNAAFAQMERQVNGQ